MVYKPSINTLMSALVGFGMLIGALLTLWILHANELTGPNTCNCFHTEEFEKNEEACLKTGHALIYSVANCTEALTIKNAVCKNNTNLFREIRCGTDIIYYSFDQGN